QDALLERLRAVLGPANVLTGVELSPYVVDGRTPEAAVFPGALEEVAAVIALCGQAEVPVVPWGGGTAASVGMPAARAGVVLGLRRLARLVEHEPGDLTVTVEAGVTIAELQVALGNRGQWLSLDPADAERATLGGVLAANAAGPRCHLYGTARDLLIGVTVVTADAAVVKGGGKVVKNVAGYDLPKLFIGSYGTLGVIVEATLKLRPVPDAERLVALRFAGLKDAAAAVRALLASDLIPNAVELLDPTAAAALGAGEAGGALGLGTGAVLVVGFDGLPEQVEWQCAELVSDREPRELGPVAGVLGEWREMARAGGGRATLERAPLAVKSQVPVWDDPGAAGRVMQRIKAQLDPKRILNPGRFVAGI